MSDPPAALKAAADEPASGVAYSAASVGLDLPDLDLPEGAAEAAAADESREPARLPLLLTGSLESLATPGAAPDGLEAEGRDAAP